MSGTCCATGRGLFVCVVRVLAVLMFVFPISCATCLRTEDHSTLRSCEAHS